MLFTAGQSCNHLELLRGVLLNFMATLKYQQKLITCSCWSVDWKKPANSNKNNFYFLPLNYTTFKHKLYLHKKTHQNKKCMTWDCVWHELIIFVQREFVCKILATGSTHLYSLCHGHVTNIWYLHANDNVSHCSNSRWALQTLRWCGWSLWLQRDNV